MLGLDVSTASDDLFANRKALPSTATIIFDASLDQSDESTESHNNF